MASGVIAVHAYIDAAADLLICEVFNAGWACCCVCRHLPATVVLERSHSCIAGCHASGSILQLQTSSVSPDRANSSAAADAMRTLMHLRPEQMICSAAIQISAKQWVAAATGATGLWVFG